MSYLTDRAAACDAAAQAHEESSAWHLERAFDARQWASAYRELEDALEADDVQAAREYATMLGLELRIAPGDVLEVVEHRNESALEERQGVAVAARGGRR